MFEWREATNEKCIIPQGYVAGEAGECIDNEYVDVAPALDVHRKKVVSFEHEGFAGGYVLSCVIPVGPGCSFGLG